MDASNRYSVLTVTVAAVLIAGVLAILTRDSWTDRGDDKDVTDLAADRGASTTLPLLPPLSSTTLALPTTTVPPIVLPTATTTKPVVPKPVTQATPAPPAPTPPPPSTTTTKPPPPDPTVEQRSENDVIFNYGPAPQDRTTGASKPSGRTGALGFVIAVTLANDTWDLTADVSNNSDKVVRFEGGIDVKIHFDCVRGDERPTEVFRLHNASFTSLPARQGVRLQFGPLRPRDPGPGSCTAFGVVRYRTD